MTEIVDLEAVFLTEMPLIDTRAPTEYAVSYTHLTLPTILRV